MFAHQHLAIICATEREFSMIKDNLETGSFTDKKIEKLYGRTFYTITFENKKKATLVQCGIGKVSSSIIATILVDHFKCDSIIFIGTAGSMDPNAHVADLVVSTACVEHDFDASIFLGERHVTFAVGKAEIEADKDLIELAEKACKLYIEEDFEDSVSAEAREKLKISKGIKVFKGVVISGDQFIGTTEGHNELKARLPQSMACEMEGAAVAQVAYEMKVPYVVIRVISDNSNDDGMIDFEDFCNIAAGYIVSGVMKRILHVSELI